jgi:hypothetical protein
MIHKTSAICVCNLVEYPVTVQHLDADLHRKNINLVGKKKPPKLAPQVFTRHYV